MSKKETVSLELEKEEALILFELLSREIDDQRGHGKLEEALGNDAELWALNGLLCSLEKTLSEPLAPNYIELVAQAEASLIRRWGEWPRD